ncbi:MAG: sigma-70 family RNA polymerase sigma factor [Acidobacteria bacterium]|nr:sigma-70 family RNA polymerase sigma factor [Acidobacteriota bacterium]
MKPEIKQFEMLYEELRPQVMRFAIRLVRSRDVAEEACAEAFLRMLQTLATHHRPMDVPEAAGWMITSVRRLIFDHWRRNQRELQAAEREVRLVARPAELYAEAIEAIERLPGLNPRHRVCLKLRYLEGMDREEIVEQTGLSENQVKSCLQYGLHMLRKGFKPVRRSWIH